MSHSAQNSCHFGDVPKPISCLDMEKQNLTQQKHAFTNVYLHTHTKLL